MRRRTNPVAVLALIIIAIAAIVLAFVVKGVLPAELEKWKGIIFWGILVGGSGVGGFLCGKLLNRK